MKRKFLLILLTVLVVFSMMSGLAMAADAPTSGSCGANGDNVTWNYDESTKTLTISGSGDMKNYNSQEVVKPWWIHGCETVVIEDGVTSIGSYTFYECKQISSVLISDSVTSIGNGAFNFCTGLKSVNLPDSVTNIGDRAFGYCSSLASVSIPSSVTSIGNYAFYNCSRLTNITLPENITSINGAFSGCSSLVSVTIPDSVTSLCDGEFSGCSSLASITIPSSVTSLGNGVFGDCSSLTSIIIPESVISLGYELFRNCSNLIDVEILGTITDIRMSGLFSMFENCNNLQKVNVHELFTLCKLKHEVRKDKLYLNGETLDNANILDYGYCGESVCWIFYADKKLNIFGNGDMAAICNDLNNILNGYTDSNGHWCPTEVEIVEIDEGVTSIGSGAFRSCAVKNITIPSTIAKINDDDFGWQIPKNIYYNGTIDEWFSLYPHNISSVIHCTDGEYNICGDNVTWNYDESTKTLTISGSGDIADYNYHRAPWEEIRKTIQTVIIEDGITGIGSEAFEDCLGIQSISIPNSVTSIGTRAFDGCANLRSIVIPEGVTTIEERTFEDCYSLVEVTIPRSIKSIGNNAFYPWDNLKKVNYAGTETEWNAIDIGIDNEQLLKVKPQNNSKFTSGSCGENVSAVFNASTGTLTISGSGNMADYGYNEAPWHNVSDKIKTVVIQDGVTTVGNYAFYNCVYLQNITIPQSIKSIGVSSFFNCGMENIIIPSGVTEIGAWAFNYCRKLQNITIPKSVLAIGDNSFGDCNKLLAVNYDGTDDEWNAINIGSDNTYLLNVKPQRIDSFTDISCGDNAKASFDASTGILTISGSGAMKDYYSNSQPTPWEDVKPAIKSVIIEEGITNIPYHAFANCINLCNIEISDGITSIGGRAFENCSSLAIITIPDSVKEMDGAVFAGCSGLESVKLPQDLTIIDNGMFDGCTSLKSINIPDSVTQIEFAAFRYCSNLQNVVIPDGIRFIEGDTFWNCKNLNSVTIPKSVVTIGYRAFGSCDNLKTVNYDGTDDEWKAISIALGNDPLLKIKGNGGEIITKQPQTFNQSFAQAVTKTMGDSPFTKTTTLTQGNGTITYDSSNQNVATVDNNGKVTIKGVGTTIIKATAAETGDWLESSIQYTLTVKQAQTQPPSGGGGGGGGGSVTPPPTKGKPTVSTNGNGGTVSADDNGKVTITPNTGYKVKDVTVNGKSVGAKSELTGLTSDDKVIVTFEKIDGEENPVVTQPTKFADVQNHWAAEAINYVVEKGMMNGVGSNQFEPNQSTSRAMIVTILYRLENEPAVTRGSSFKDVADGQYYSKAVAWANANGIVTGYSDTEFVPNGNITREQMSSILSRYAKYKGVDTTSTGSLGNFADGRYVSNYAQGAMSWAVEMKLIQGDSGKLNPTAGATRAEVATILMRYCENILK